ncbi:type IV pilus twitching motility protein PilT [Calothrix sp. CCY 0018]|uniref:type IV pilus twitching motility protein PilT n=1 Tax=Calothrix sp. CCY 0018 TaxID=3103864 RepID=UPI0039C6450A
MTQTPQRPPTNTATNRTGAPSAPPMPPPPPASTLSTQRQSSQQTIEMPNGSRGLTNPAAHRPGAPPPMAKNIPSTNSQPTFKQLILEANEKGFSDIHLGVGEIPRFRNRGEIDTTDYPETDRETFMSWLRETLTEEEIKRFQETLDFDGATQFDFARVRINIFDSLKGYAMVLRLIPVKILSMEQLNLPPVFRDICHYHKGLVLVTGPTGSGKSTTMAAMIDYINREMSKHIITIEDPVEFVHQSRKSLVKQREVGMHTRKFDNALKAALREDPDLILVGEMRDKETVNTAMKAAQTGHLVMGTLHTNSAVKTIERILNLFPGEEQDPMRVAISESLVAVISQGLCRTTDGKRAAFHDILINTEAVKDWIKDSKYDEMSELMKQASFDGMITMNQSLFNLYQEGKITEETALEMSPTPNEMAQMLRGRV